MCVSSSMSVIRLRPIPISTRAVMKYVTSLVVDCTNGAGSIGGDRRPQRYMLFAIVCWLPIM